MKKETKENIQKETSEIQNTKTKKKNSKPALVKYGTIDKITKTGGYSMPPEAYMGYPP